MHIGEGCNAREHDIMPISKELEKYIESIPPGDEGWWNSSGREDFIKEAERLLSFSVPEDTIKDVFTNLYSAVAGEYGS